MQKEEWERNTCNILLTLLAPKTLWTMANFWGSSEGKYGAKMQSFEHLRLNNLQEAQGELPPIFYTKTKKRGN